MFKRNNLFLVKESSINFKHTDIFEAVNIAAVSNLTKEEYMNYEKDLMASWDEYAIKRTIEHDHQVAIEKAMEKGREEEREELVRNLLAHTDFTISKIATLANVSEAFVRKVKKEIK